MTVVWAARAIADLAAIRSYIADDAPSEARRIAGAIIAAAESLNTLPRRGRPGRATGTRELVLAGWPWIIVYEVTGAQIAILRIRHDSRRL
jgi:toxin ParE1/3/4